MHDIQNRPWNPLTFWEGTLANSLKRKSKQYNLERYSLCMWDPVSPSIKSAIQTSVYLMTWSTPTQQAHQEKCIFLQLLQFASNPFWTPEQKWCCKLLKLKKSVGKEGINIQQKAVMLVLNSSVPDLWGPVNATGLKSSFTTEEPHRTLSIHCLIQTLNAQHSSQKTDRTLKNEFYHKKMKSPLEQTAIWHLMSSG